MGYWTAYEMLRIAAISSWFIWSIGILFAGAVLLLKLWQREWPSIKRLAPTTAAGFLFYCVAYVRANSYEGATPVPEIAAISAGYFGLGCLLLVVSWREFMHAD